MFRLKPVAPFNRAETAHASDDQATFALDKCGFDLSGRHLVLAVSGGADSMAMAAHVKAWQEKKGAAKSIRAVIVDHGIRAKSSIEAEWVEAQLTAMKMPAQVLKVTASAPKAGMQAWARGERYELLTAEARKDNAVVLVAHHEQDQVETIAMRLQAGSGLGGLRGMQKVTTYDDIIILRPFLDCSPQSLHQIMVANRILHVEDPSNRNDSFERIAIRTRLDAIAKKGIAASDLLKLGNLSARINQSLHKALSASMRTHMGMVKAGAVWLSRDHLLMLPDAAAIMILRELASHISVKRQPLSMGQATTLLGRLKTRSDAQSTAQSNAQNNDGIAATLGGLEWNLQKDLIWVYPEAEKAAKSIHSDKGRSLFEKRWQVYATIEGKLAAMGAERAAELRKTYPQLHQDWTSLTYEGRVHTMPMRGLWQLPVFAPASLRAELSSPDDLLTLEDGVIIPHVVDDNSFNIAAHQIMMKMIKKTELF